MNKIKLACEIVNISKYFEIFKINDDNVFLAQEILNNLDNITFIENLLDMLYTKIIQKRFNNAVNREKTLPVLIQLEIIKLNLEFEEAEYCKIKKL